MDVSFDEQDLTSRCIGANESAIVYSWSANQICGAPRVYPRYGDHHGAWAQGHTNGTEWVEVRVTFHSQVTSICLILSLC